MSQPRQILVAVAWPYASGSRHLGHLAGAYLPADIFARYHRTAGNRVLMVSGSDVHGTPITVRADAEGVSPQEIVDRYHSEFLANWRAVGISWDLYTSTGTDNHAEVTQDVFMRLLDNGFLVKKTSDMFFDEEANRFLPDRYVEGTCPHCGYEEARGRPVRQLRPDAGPRRAHRSPLETERSDPRDATDGTLFPEALRIAGARGGVARHARGLAVSCSQLGQELRQRGTPRSGHHSRPRVGCSRTCRRPRRGQAHLCVVRCCYRLLVSVERMVEERRSPRSVAVVVGERRSRDVLLRWQGQHSVPCRDVARHVAWLRRAQPSHQYSCQPVRHVQGRQSFCQSRRGTTHRLLHRAASARRIALCIGVEPAGAQRHRYHRSRARAGSEPRARCYVGQSGESGVQHELEELQCGHPRSRQPRFTRSGAPGQGRSSARGRGGPVREGRAARQLCGS